MCIYWADTNTINTGFNIVFNELYLGEVLDLCSFKGEVAYTVRYITPCGINEVAHIHGTKVLSKIKSKKGSK